MDEEIIKLRAFINDNWDIFMSTTVAKIDIKFEELPPFANACVFYKNEKFHIMLSNRFRGNIKGQEFLSLHELWHIWLGHLTPRWHPSLYPDHTRLNYAQDIAIHENITPAIDDCVTAAKYKLEGNQTTQFYYNALEGKKLPKMETLTLEQLLEILKNGGDVQFGDVIIGDNFTEQEMKEFAKEIQRLAGSMPGNLRRAVNKEKKIRFGAVVRALANQVDPGGGKGIKKTWAYPNRRNKSFRGKIRRNKTKALAILDVSGSITQDDLDNLAGGLQGLNEFCKIFVLVVDTEIHEMFWFKGKLPKLTGGGGTNFNSAFKYAIENKFRNIFVLTDGYCTHPSTIPANIKVIWGVINHESFSPKYGRVIHLT